MASAASSAASAGVQVDGLSAILSQSRRSKAEPAAPEKSNVLRDHKGSQSRNDAMAMTDDVISLLANDIIHPTIETQPPTSTTIDNFPVGVREENLLLQNSTLSVPQLHLAQLVQAPTDASEASASSTGSCTKLTAEMEDSLKPQLHGLISVAVLLFVLLGLILSFLLAAHKFKSDPNLSARSPKLLVASVVCATLSIGLVSLTSVFDFGFSTHCTLVLWTQNFALPLVMLIQLLRMVRLRRLCVYHSLKIELSKGAPVYSGPATGSSSDAMFRTRDKLLEYEARLDEFGVPQCKLLATSIVGLVMCCASPMVLFLLQVGQLARLRHHAEAFHLKVEFGLLVAINGAYIVSQLIGGLVLAGDQPAIVLLIQAHASAAGLLLVLGVLIPLVAMLLALRKGKVRYVQNFDDFFAVTVSREFFSDFLYMEMNSEWILFWQDVETYKAIMSANSESATPEAHALHECIARNIYSKYMRAGSMMDIKLDTVLRQEVAFRVNTSVINNTVFDAAQDFISERLQNTYCRFLRHPMSVQAMQTYLRKVLDTE